MSRSAAVTLDWGDGQHTFRLRIGELRELQEKCDAGPAFIMQRLFDGGWMVNDLTETIRLGLLGGDSKMTAVQAVKLVRRYVEERPLAENVKPAYAILAAAVVGVPDEPLGKSEADPETDENLSQEVKSGSPPSTPAEP